MTEEERAIRIEENTASMQVARHGMTEEESCLKRENTAAMWATCCRMTEEEHAVRRGNNVCTEATHLDLLHWEVCPFKFYRCMSTFKCSHKLLILALGVRLALLTYSTTLDP